MGSRFFRYMLTGALMALAVAMATEVFRHFNPGALSPDSLNILTQARTGVFEDGHPPLMAAIWRLIDRVLPGPIGMLVMHLTLFYGSLVLIFRWAALRHHYLVLPAFVFVGLYPPITAILGVIWIDITMACFYLAAVGIFLAGYKSQSKRTRGFALGGALVLTALGLAVRHNGAAGAYPLIVLFVYQRFGSRTTLRRFVIALALGAFLTSSLFFVTKKLSALSVDVNRHLWRAVAIYDIAGTSYHEKTFLFDPEVLTPNDITNVNKLYSPRSYFPLMVGEQIHAMPGQPIEKGKKFEPNDFNPNLDYLLFANWIDVVAHHPQAYFRHRYNFFVGLVTRSPWGLWAPVFDQIYPNNLGVAERVASDSTYFSFVRTISQQGLTFIPLFYLIVSALAVIPAFFLGLKFHNDILLTAACLYGSGLAHMVGLFFVAVSPDSRYSHWLITATVLATSLVLLELLKSIPIGWVSNQNRAGPRISDRRISDSLAQRTAAKRATRGARA